MTEAVRYGKDVYCLSCLPIDVGLDEVIGISESEVVEDWPQCVECGEVHTYMRMVGDFSYLEER